AGEPRQAMGDPGRRRSCSHAGRHARRLHCRGSGIHRAAANEGATAMKTLVLLIAFIALGTIALGSSRSRGIRLASRLVSFIGFMFFGLVTVASLYGMFALEGKGAGVLLFIAIP